MRRIAVKERRQVGPLALALAITGAAGCEPSQVRQVQLPIRFSARADEPLAGVAISIEGKKRLGVTGPDGILQVTLSGPEGTAVPFRVACPPGYRAPREMPVLTLRRFTGLEPSAAARGIEVSIECPPAERMAALVLKAGRPDLPVLAQGREVARTDASGVAHALVKMEPNTSFRVVVDTSHYPRLRPQSPSTTLALTDSDEIFLIEQAFEIDAPSRPAPGIKRGHRQRRIRPPPEPTHEQPTAKPPPENLGQRGR